VTLRFPLSVPSVPVVGGWMNESDSKGEVRVAMSPVLAQQMVDRFPFAAGGRDNGVSGAVSDPISLCLVR